MLPRAIHILDGIKLFSVHTREHQNAYDNAMLRVLSNTTHNTTCLGFPKCTCILYAKERYRSSQLMSDTRKGDKEPP